MKHIKERARNTPVLDEADVLVAGGGLSGIAAAIAAARAGARTILIERNGVLGGVVTSGMMSSMTNWFIGSKGTLLVRGIGVELLDRLVDMKGTIAGWRSAELPQFPLDQETLRYVIVDMVREAGVEVLLHTFASDVQVEEGSVRATIIESKSGRSAILGKIVVDATGDADIVARAGSPFKYTPPGSNSLEFLMDGVDMQKTFEFFRENRDKWRLTEEMDVPTTYEQFERNWLERGMFHLPHGGGSVEHSPLWGLVEKGVTAGDYAREKGNCVRLGAFGLFGLRLNNTTVVNTGFFERLAELDVKDVSQAEIEARSLIPYVAAFLRKYVPGFAEARVIASASDLGVRVTRWIEGDYVLTIEDQLRESRFTDVVGVLPLTSAWYAFVQRIPLEDRGGLAGVKEKERYFDVPYRCMIPKGLNNVIVASGKSASTEPRAILRGQASCLLLGQAAGAAAALAATHNTTSRDIETPDLQRTLLHQNVYLGDEARLAGLGLS